MSGKTRFLRTVLGAILGFMRLNFLSVHHGVACGIKSNFWQVAIACVVGFDQLGGAPSTAAVRVPLGPDADMWSRIIPLMPDGYGIAIVIKGYFWRCGVFAAVVDGLRSSPPCGSCVAIGHDVPERAIKLNPHSHCVATGIKRNFGGKGVADVVGFNQARALPSSIRQYFPIQV